MAGYVLISRAFMIACVVLPVVVFDAGVSGTVAGFVLASLVTCVAGLKLSSVPFRNVSPVKSRLTVRELLRFSMPVFASSMYGFVIGSASQFLVSRYLGVEDFALFANGYRELPLAGMIIGAAAGVLLPEFSRMSVEGADGGQFVRLWQAAVLKSSAIIYPLSVFCRVFAPEIICLLYGEGYREAAGLFRIVTLVNLARIMPYAPVLFALGRGKAFARAHLVTALLIVGLELWCVMVFPSLWAIAAIATGCTFFCLFLLMTATARVLGTSLAGLMPWRMLTIVLLVSAAACTAARLAVLLTGMTHHLVVVSVGFAVYLSLYLPFAQRAGIRYMELLGPVLAKLRPNRT